MTDLSKLDHQIVEAAEKWVKDFEGFDLLTDQSVKLRQAVLAKRKAQQDLWPSCTYNRVDTGRCNRKPTVQRAERNDGGLLLTDFYCEAHQIRTSEIGP